MRTTEDVLFAFLTALITALAIIAYAPTANASVNDASGPQDVLGHPEVDLYDATGAQRGTATNPIYTQNSSGATSVKAGGASAVATDSALVVAQRPYNYKLITGNQTVTLKTGAGMLHSIIIGNNATGGVIAVYDNTSGSGTQITAAYAGTPTGGLLSTTGIASGVTLSGLDVGFSTGLTVVTSGSTNNVFTVIYQ